jgi:hypothetical protein
MNVEFNHRVVETNGIRMHVVEADHAVAPGMRGYGQTDRPEAIDQYSLLHLVGDIVGLVDALGEPTAVIVGHDWGAPGNTRRAPCPGLGTGHPASARYRPCPGRARPRRALRGARRAGRSLWWRNTPFPVFSRRLRWEKAPTQAA